MYLVTDMLPSAEVSISCFQQVQKDQKRPEEITADVQSERCIHEAPPAADRLKPSRVLPPVIYPHVLLRLTPFFYYH